MSDDTALAWTCAANLALWDEDPGPRAVNVGSRGEPRVVDRREALVGVYARQILVSLEADEQRLLVLVEDCRRRAAQERTLRERWRSVRERRARHETRLRTLGGVVWPSRWGLTAMWTVAAELADAAVRMVQDAGADRDGKARARLLASTRHTLTYDVLGGMLPADVEAQAAVELADTLHRIDQAES